MFVRTIGIIVCVLNFWNPAGWLGLAVILGSMIVSVAVEAIGGWFAFAFDVALFLVNTASFIANGAVWINGLSSMGLMTAARAAELIAWVAALPSWVMIAMTVAQVYFLAMEYYYYVKDYTMAEAFSQVASDIGTAIGSVVGAVTDGVWSFLKSSGILGWALVAGSAFVGYKVLTSDGPDEGSPIVLTKTGEELGLQS